MSILENIIAEKRKEIEKRKGLTPTARLETSVHFDAPVVSLSNYITRPDKAGIIAEIKRRSPSKGVINENISVEKVSIGYMQAGASALSVLTDQPFFGGSDKDLTVARAFNYCPILRKDFIVDEYQILESKALGADAILLIAECLSKTELTRLGAAARSLSLEVILEIQSPEDLPETLDVFSVIGVNHRSLVSFEIDLEKSARVLSSIPKDRVRIAESGIRDPKTAAELRGLGYDGFLIGEQFMRNANPEDACAEFIRELKRLAPRGAGTTEAVKA